MLKIRLQRIGRKNDPAFRTVLTDSKNSTKSGKFLEILGTYNPKAAKKEDKTNFKNERIQYWISKGAKLSDTMHNFLVHDNVLTGKKINVLPKKKPTKSRKDLKEGPKEETATAAPTSPAGQLVTEKVEVKKEPEVVPEPAVEKPAEPQVETDKEPKAEPKTELEKEPKAEPEAN